MSTIATRTITNSTDHQGLNWREKVILPFIRYQSQKSKLYHTPQFLNGIRNIFTGRNEVVAKVIFLHLFVILFTGGGAPVGRTPPARGEPSPARENTPPHPTPLLPGVHPPRQGEPPRDQTPPPGSRLQHTVNERPVRILLECILVLHC